MKVLMLILIFTLFCGASETNDRGKKKIDPRINGFRKNYKKKKNKAVTFKYSGRKFKWEEKNDNIPIPLSIEELLKETVFPPEIDPDERPVKKPFKKKVLKTVGYTGEKKNNLRHGNGKLTLENGDTYTGHWNEGKKHGHGIYIFASGIKYSGNWMNDKMDGQGSLIFPNGNLFAGEMKENEITGYGIFKYADGSSYKGMWKEGKWEGEGLYSLTDGRAIHAVFADNQIIKLISQDEDIVNNEDGGEIVE